MKQYRVVEVRMPDSVSCQGVEDGGNSAEYDAAYARAVDVSECRSASERGSYQMIYRAMFFLKKEARPFKKWGYTEIDAYAEALHDVMLRSGYL